MLSGGPSSANWTPIRSAKTFVAAITGESRTMIGSCASQHATAKSANTQPTPSPRHKSVPRLTWTFSPTSIRTVHLRRGRPRPRHALRFQQRTHASQRFRLAATEETAQSQIRRHHAVARHLRRERIFAQRTADRLRRPAPDAARLQR
jgi:GMP synthase-like glutamine amidotransferase